ncbi:hypothetical protein [Parvicella tangerina]|uniref:Uncharacterized protein n=1 Tax=Parvicella tangerina TaxID=2829795 RepID=A0A916JKK2_9FLAO|nr:hypothetical protein [Parvicella tangerina]CAG5078517.1 hypothetical protein CRYO30217_00696 [Parvicella tangerina]
MSIERRRNIFGVLLVLSLAVPTLSTISWLQYQKKEVKREVKRMLKTSTPKEELVEFNFNLFQYMGLDWKKRHEFELNGKMYDIVYQEITNSNVHYWCWLDKEETALNAQLDQLLQIALTGNSRRRSKEVQLDLFLKSMIAQSANLIEVPNNISSEQIESIDSIYESVDQRTPSPPPERLFIV